MNTTSQALSILSLLALSGAPAFAQSAPQGSGGLRFARPLTTVSPQQPGVTSSGSVVMMNKTDGGDSYELTITGDKTTAKVNGKEVPKDRIRRDGDKVEILDKDGDVQTAFDLSASHLDVYTAPGGTMRLWAGPNGALALGGQNGAGFGGPVDSVPAPKVMLGVTMLEPSESLAEHLDLEPGTGVLLNSVMDGLPADKAGLKKGDVIVSFDGAKPITVTRAREILAKKSGGDKVQVVVLRKGEEKSVTLELQKYDPSKLKSEVVNELAPGGHDAAAVRRQLDDAMKQGHTYTWSGSAGPGAQGFVFGPGQDKLEVFSSPNSGEMKERMAALDKKLSDLDDKMSKLDDQLSRLEKKLDKLNSR